MVGPPATEKVPNRAAVVQEEMGASSGNSTVYATVIQPSSLGTPTVRVDGLHITAKAWNPDGYKEDRGNRNGSVLCVVSPGHVHLLAA